MHATTDERGRDGGEGGGARYSGHINSMTRQRYAREPRLKLHPREQSPGGTHHAPRPINPGGGATEEVLQHAL
jgi:hypothetical protein